MSTARKAGEPAKLGELVAVMNEHRRASETAGHLYGSSCYLAAVIVRGADGYFWVRDGVTDRLLGLYSSRHDADKALKKARDKADKEWEAAEALAAKSPERIAAARAKEVASNAATLQASGRAHQGSAPMTQSESFEARAIGHYGSVIKTWVGTNVRSLMGTVDAELPLEKAWEVSIRGEYTSDGSYHPDHGGRVVATRSRGGFRGHGGWIVE